jgi:hypothetical protein
MAVSPKKNRGEWSELFVLIKLLSTGALPYDLGEGNPKKTTFPVISISRNISGTDHLFRISHGSIEIEETSKQSVISKISQQSLSLLASDLLKQIKAGNGRAFNVPSADGIMSMLGIEKVTEIKSKDDLRITIYDPRTKQQNSQGFSVKSFLGANPSLLNASGVTNIEFEVLGALSEFERAKHNKLGPIALVSSLIKNGHKLVLSKIDDRFSENLKMIDSNMDSLIGHIVISSYTGRGRAWPDIVKILKDENPLNYASQNSESRYTHKIKDLLEAVALGMRPSEPWAGTSEAEGGTLIVTSSGEIMCHHSLDKDSLRNYLFSNTYIDTPSRSKWKFGSIVGNKLILNFQIRVKK